ncbi:MAG: hypothetical protein ABI604_17405, partial [Nitrospirota bacterium]
RYVSAGSIEYWPDPQQGIREAYRVVKSGGLALMIGPLEPEQPLIRFIARTWMLFPREEEYWKWFTVAGFTNIRVQHIRPQWYRGKEEYALAIVGMKPRPGLSTTAPSSDHAEDVGATMTPLRRITLLVRVVIGSFLGFLFVPIALAAYCKNNCFGTSHIPPHERERLNPHQITVLLLLCVTVAALGWMMFVE